MGAKSFEIEYEYPKNAIAAMPTMPAASPSRPSTKFTAFIVVTTTTTVSTTSTGVGRYVTAPGSGIDSSLHALRGHDAGGQHLPAQAW
ncbi:hypothetical protein GCM10025868_38630 [Angustibacter aerolatus]|uniref:Uncharacterized protein n=1 Tax=Angustibacter aerolatus TaxID=1162965 RepID=A0ABQ6JKU0_9ACTN|nr:hypothetical protein GCM10025868_38630 [Angustibacter aerolatus]